MDKLGAISDRDRIRLTHGLARLDLNCPPLPHTLFEALSIREHSGIVDHDRVIRMVHRDPLLVARLLKMVNSAYFGFAREVDSVDRAVRLLGPASVAGLVLSMNVAKLQATLDGPAGDLLTKLIREGLAASRCSEILWTLLVGKTGVRRAASAGLLSGFGQIVLVYNYPEEALQVYEPPAQGFDRPVEDRERSAFGYTSQEAADYLAAKQAFPEHLVNLLQQTTAQGTPLNVVVGAARELAEALGFGLRPPMDTNEVRLHSLWLNLSTTFPERAGDSQWLADEVLKSKDDVARHVFQLLARRTHRAA